MKNITRAFVVLLAITGATASTQIASASQKSGKIAAIKTSDFPVPMCPPDDPDGCGWITH